MSQTDNRSHGTMETNMFQTWLKKHGPRKEPERRLGPSTWSFPNRRRKEIALNHLRLLDEAPSSAEDAIMDASLIEAWLAGDLEVGLMRSTSDDDENPDCTIAFCFALAGEDKKPLWLRWLNYFGRNYTVFLLVSVAVTVINIIMMFIS